MIGTAERVFKFGKAPKFAGSAITDIQMNVLLNDDDSKSATNSSVHPNLIGKSFDSINFNMTIIIVLLSTLVFLNVAQYLSNCRKKMLKPTKSPKNSGIPDV